MAADTRNILFIASEADPFIKIGGLGDVLGSLPQALHKLSENRIVSPKVDIRLAIPYYGEIQKKSLVTKKVATIPVNSRQGPVVAEVYEHKHAGLTVYFIAGDPIRVEEPVYGADFVADVEKFIFFSLACLQLPKALGWRLDVLHAHDWHTAIALHQLEQLRKVNPFYTSVRSVLTIHNLPFMGSGSEQVLENYLISPSTAPDLPEWAKTLPLPMGLAAADSIVAVSPSYSKEIQTSEYGCGLEGFFKSQKHKLSGILNGLDLETWDPMHDKLIEQPFESRSLELKSKNKLSLQREFAFDESTDIPLLIMVSRMDTQKGVDLVVDALKNITSIPWQAILLGSGNKRLEDLCQSLELEFPDRVRARIAFDYRLSHRLYAGGDILLMPSRYEPCGLAQMIAMRYGCIPVARATGGLKDTITTSTKSSTGNGYLFRAVTSQALASTILKALEDFNDKPFWNKIQQCAMEFDFSWQKSALEYFTIYESLLNKTSQPAWRK